MQLDRSVSRPATATLPHAARSSTTGRTDRQVQIGLRSSPPLATTNHRTDDFATETYAAGHCLTLATRGHNADWKHRNHPLLPTRAEVHFRRDTDANGLMGPASSRKE